MTKGMITKVKHLVRVVEEVTGEDAMKLSEIADKPGARKPRAASAAASAPAKARPPGAASRARRRAPACASKGSKAARCRCTAACPSAGSRTCRSPRSSTRSISAASRQAIDAGKLDPAGTIDVAALVKAGMLRREKDGVRLLGDGELKAKVAFAVAGASKSAVGGGREGRRHRDVLAPKPTADEQAA